jgi:CPA2 family monovalent cation:H+ antiporter-2
VCGDATEAGVLIQAHIAKAAMLVVATSSPLNVRKMAETARALNPGIEIVVRTHGEDEARLLHGEGIGVVFCGEEELARSMSRHVLERFLPAPAPAH